MAGICGRRGNDGTGWKYTENKDRHYTTAYTGQSYSLAECHHTPVHKRYQHDRGFTTSTRMLPPPLQISTQLSPKNSTQHARRTQAETLYRVGYRGPIQAGEVKALKNLLTKLGKQDHVVHAWRLKTVDGTWGRKFERLQGPCYLFKSPIPGLDFKDFIMLARMYRDGKGLKPAVEELMKRVPSELKTEAETFRTLDVLAGLGGN